MPNTPSTIYVDLEPVGRRATAEPGTTLLAAAQSSGVELVAVCGGLGTCGSCRVRLAAGKLSPLTIVEENEFSADEIKAGCRLACQAEVLSDVRIDIPPESLTAAQRLQIEGQSVEVPPDPVVVPVDVQLAPPTLDDLRSDVTRLRDALSAVGHPVTAISYEVLTNCSERLRAQKWSARAAIHKSSGKVTALLPRQRQLLGLAVDIGTTKVAAYLVDLATGSVLAKSGAMNPQIGYGEDVISRITYANSGPAAREVLHTKIVDGLNALAGELCAMADVTREQIVDAVVVGNTAMHHLFTGLSVRQLGEAPYVAAVSEPLELQARDVGLQLAPGATLYVPPNIAGYVGADHVSMLLASGMAETARTVVALDIGTNTEISLASGGHLRSCSTASGPAFEGAHIREGMRAVPGAIERVRCTNGTFQTHTIGGVPPVGICGSGILDAIAEAYSAGILDHRGVPQASNPHVIRVDDQAGYILVPAAATGHGRDIIVTRSDVNEIQLAKGAMRAGVEILLAESGLTDDDIDEVIIAGAFGTYLDVNSGIRIGMFPNLPVEKFRQIGNAAGLGAQHMLISHERRAMAEALVNHVEYVELTAHAEFTDTFVEALYFE